MTRNCNGAVRVEGGGGGGGGGGGMKKGPWTAAEDEILTEYVRRHGEGNWNAVRRNTGLLRCGKSCRLRWMNHLRPDLKKGSFTPQEELVIARLHAQLGNKWALMASQVRTRYTLHFILSDRIGSYQSALCQIVLHFDFTRAYFCACSSPGGRTTRSRITGTRG